MAQERPVSANTKYVREALRRAREAGFVRLGANVFKDNMTYLDEFKSSHGLRNRDDAINALIAEHRALLKPEKS